ncbi:hypothetical protein AB0M22_22440 [Nocardia sp. NPDC051756]|uniref:hypothetical protein n=1 Tax=Nocardia sp. NPDC051756 TaxID=3154751 RepID=UPI003448384C
MSITAAFTSQAVLLGAVLYYFGSVYTRTWYSYFGIDAGMLGLSPVELTMRSLTPTFWPVVVALLVLLVLVAVRGLPFLIARKTRKPRRTLRIWYALTLGVGAAALAIPALIGLGVRYAWSLLSTLQPSALILGALLLGYATTLRATYPALLRRPSLPGRPRPRHRSATRPPTTAVMIALLGLGFAGTLWSIGAYAAQQGITDARALAHAGFPDQPSILVFSVDRLGIEGTGTQVDEITVPGEKYRYLYSGVRLLARTPDTYFVIPQQWRPHRDRVFVIARNDTLRIDISTTRNDN